MAKPGYIAIAGNIGCGKSTLTDFICKNYQIKPFFEPNANNPYLVDYYNDMKKWAFHSQLYFLTHKFKIMQIKYIHIKTENNILYIHKIIQHVFKSAF